MLFTLQGLLNFPIFKKKTILTPIDVMENPLGRGTANGFSREKSKKSLNDSYDKLARTNKFKHKIMKDEGGVYYFIVTVPSEKYDSLTYDVALKLYPNPSLSNEEKERAQLTRYAIKVFSNSPAFMFTYAYIMNRHTLLVDELINKFGSSTLDKIPSVRNPNMTYGFEKSIYFAIKYLRDNKLLVMGNIVEETSKFSKMVLWNSIMAPELKLQQYNNIKLKINKDNKKSMNTKRIPTSQFE